MRFIFLTQYYPPETGAPQNRLSDLAERLVAQGHTVTVLTAMPNYPTGSIFPEYRGRLYVREQRNGVSVHRTWIFARRTRKVVPWLFHYLSFVFTSALVGPFVLPRADVLITESPPLFLGVAGRFLAWVRGARFMLNVADLWPHAGVELGIIRKRYQVRILEWLERALYRSSIGTTAQTAGIAEHIRNAAKPPVHLLTNGADTARFGRERADQQLLAQFDLRDRFIVGYAGLHGPAQALHVVIDAAARLTDRHDVVFAFFGDGPTKPSLEARVRELGLNNVRFFPLLPASAMPGLIPLWSVGIVPLYNGELMKGALPSKMFEYMASGVPIVVSAPEGEASAIVTRAHAGLHVAPENADALAAAIERLYDDHNLRAELGRNARACIERDYDRARIARDFAAFAQQVTVA